MHRPLGLRKLHLICGRNIDIEPISKQHDLGKIPIRDHPDAPIIHVFDLCHLEVELDHFSNALFIPDDIAHRKITFPNNR